MIGPQGDRQCADRGCNCPLIRQWDHRNLRRHIVQNGSQMRQKVLIFGVGFLVGLSCLLGAALVHEVTTGTGKAPTEHVSGNLLPAVAGLSTAEPEASKAASSVEDQLKVTGWLSEIVPAVVRISTKSVTGSGVVIEPIGVVLTSAHVVGDNTHVQVLIENSKHLTGTVYRIDAIRDLALVHLPPGDYRSARLDQGPSVVLGAPVTAIGYPLDLAGPATVTAGIVSRILYQPDSEREVIQTDAAINLGNSGGPLLDASGQVIGIIASVFGEYKSRPTSGISYAVSISTITEDFLGFTPTE